MRRGLQTLSVKSSYNYYYSGEVIAFNRKKTILNVTSSLTTITLVKLLHLTREKTILNVTSSLQSCHSFCSKGISACANMLYHLSITAQNLISYPCDGWTRHSMFFKIYPTACIFLSSKIVAV